ncbi:cyclin B3 [Rhinolophus ferrumequinum]|uniref:Cyclin B3 n=1 Tax=Rhinolophus ferrumequinum TaxID=59479 RepID=A0A7J8AUK5_RHIFE|nr:G2/mitotic-specific cyclin-B3 isoform X2 [Rhinolophus ferrumequinum]KAF6389770.1 cyclin B3 [Rhinolophus ferrumequinum]
MPLPLPPRGSKREAKKSRSSKIVPSDHGQSEKRGENYRAKISPSSPQGPLKKRSALEDVTNASQSQPAQLKKEANKESVKDVSKKINRNTPTLRLAENDEMNTKKYTLEHSPVAVSTTMVTNTVEKPLLLEMTTISQTPTTEEASLFKNPLVLKEEPTNRDAVLTKTSLSLKKHTNQGEASLLEKPPSWQKETDSDYEFAVEPMTFVKKHETEKAAITKRTSSLKKMCTYQGKQSCYGEEVALQDINAEEHSSMEPMNFMKKPKTEEVMLPTRLLTLKKKCATQGKMFHKKKPLILQKTTSGEKWLMKEQLSFNKKPTTEESLFQEPSLLQEKHTTQGKVALLKKPWALQENIHSKDEFVMEPVSFRMKHTTDEAASTKETLSLKKNKPTIPIMTSTCPELVDLQNTVGKGNDSLFMEPVSFRKKSSTEGAIVTKTPFSLKKKRKTQRKMTLLNKPLVLEKSTSEEESIFKKPLPCKKKPSTDEEFLFQFPSVLKEKHSTLQEVSLSEKPSALQEKTTTEEESDIQEPLEEKRTTEGELLSQEPFSLHVKPTNKYGPLFGKSLNVQKTDAKEDSLKMLLALQKKSTTEEKSLFKKPLILKKKLSTEATTSIESQLSQKKPTAQGEAFFSRKQLVFQENITNEEQSLLKQPLALQEKPGSEKEAILKEPLALQEKPTIEEEAILKELLTLQEKPSSEKEAILEELLALQENSSSEEAALFKEPLAFQGQPTISEACHFKEILPLNGKPTTGQELSFEKPVALQENPTYTEDTFPKDFFIPQVKTSPHVSSTVTESTTGMSSTSTMSSMSKFSTTSNSSACESSSNKPFSPWDKRSQNEIAPLEDIEKDHNYQFFNSVYAKDIFTYMKQREEKFILKKYMNRQTDINSDMRAILVDWLVEVQMTFEVSHETLYLAVKLVDHYLMEVICKRDKLQLIGSTAFLIAAKFEEPYPPCVDDFLYICDDIYQRKEMLAVEISILQTLNFDINIPVAYHFLRRYAVCLRADMNILTLSRFVCEMTLQEYDYIHERASKLAAGCFLLALYMKKLGHWAPTLECYSGYKTSDLHPLVKQLNNMLTSRSSDKLKTVHSKYSHQVFFEVTKIPPLDVLELEEIMNSC